MRRTQLYLEEELWATLHARADREKTTVSELMRAAARIQYMNPVEQRLAALDAFIGIRADRPEFDDVDAYIRNLRRGDRRRTMLAK